MLDSVESPRLFDNMSGGRNRKYQVPLFTFLSGLHRQKNSWVLCTLILLRLQKFRSAKINENMIVNQQDSGTAPGRVRIPDISPIILIQPAAVCRAKADM